MDLISIDSLSDSDISDIFELGQRYFDERRSGTGIDPALSGMVLFNLFFENSTRTLMSFAVAAHALGGSAITLPVEQSSAKKGESLEDMARTLDSMRPDLLAIRHGREGAAAAVAQVMDCPVINAGDGTNEHPTQALLDAATIRRRFGRVEGLRVAICGDIRHSRVARSSAGLLARLGAEVRLSGPPELLPEDVQHRPIDEAVEGAQVVMMLRLQRERLAGDFGDSPGEYLERYGLTRERFARTAPDSVVLHPGPINRGVEIEDSVADDAGRSLILDQVEMGVAIRMACLARIAAPGAGR